MYDIFRDKNKLIGKVGWSEEDVVSRPVRSVRILFEARVLFIDDD